MLILAMASCKKAPQHLSRIEGKLITVDTTVSYSPQIDSIITPYKTKLDAEMQKILAYAPTDLYKDRSKPETNIGNFMADLCYDRGNSLFTKQTQKTIDFCLLNFGGIRAGIPKGPVSLRNAFEVMPFENSMVVVEMRYEKIQELLEYLAKSESAHPISKQLHLVFNNGILSSAKLNKKALDPKRTYFVLTSDYLQHGGDHMDFFKDPIHLYNLDYKIRAAIIDELTGIDTIRAKIDGRVIRKESKSTK